MSTPTINPTLFASVRALDAQPGGTSAPKVARALDIPLSTAGRYLAISRGKRHGNPQRKRRRYVVFVHDPLLDEDFQHAAFAEKRRAQREASELNARYVRWSGGRNMPLAYVVREARKVRKGRVA